MPGEHPCREGAGGAGGQQAQRGSAASPGSQEGSPHPGVPPAQHGQPGRRGDYPAVSGAAAASPGALCAGLGPTM